MRRLCTICARGGSKGVLGKNVRPLAGKPLLVYSIEQAAASGLFEAIAVSSDSAGILEVADRGGADQLIERPAEMATDEAGKVPAIRHCAARVEEGLQQRFEVVVDLQATSPLRLPEDIRGAVALLEARGVSSVITGTPARCSPYFNLVELNPDGFVRLSKPIDPPPLRRQDVPTTFDMNGSVYVWRRDALMAEPAVFYPDTLIYEMPAERSCDIDTELDFAIAELLARLRLEPETPPLRRGP